VAIVTEANNNNLISLGILAFALRIFMGKADCEMPTKGTLMAGQMPI